MSEYNFTSDDMHNALILDLHNKTGTDVLPLWKLIRLDTYNLCTPMCVYIFPKTNCKENEWSNKENEWVTSKLTLEIMIALACHYHP